MALWEKRLIIVAVVLLVTAIAARVVDRRIARKPLPPEAITRYRVLRRSISIAIVLVGVLSALLVIPQVRAVAGGILASSAVVGLVLGFAAQRTIGNFIAGLLIAFSQPLRLGDDVEIDGVEGVVEEIGLTYTFIRTRVGDRLVIPNEKLASDTIRNSSIVSREKVAEVTVQVPLESDLPKVVDLLHDAAAGERDAEVFVTGLNGEVTLAVRARAADEAAAERLQSQLLVRAHTRLREAGILK
jgi:small-conductance mechanosensitive channel